jgi:thiamine-phosphate pyrophosphorylase
MERSEYRIIDANFNRAREAVRMMEEFCRFVLNSAALTERAKRLRHQLSASIAKLDMSRLLAARDTLADVGVGAKVPEQIYRQSIYDSFTAACKRLVEALRVLAETIYPLNKEAAEDIENLRYTAYTLEKDISVFSQAASRFAAVRLYVIISSDLPAHIISLTYRCLQGGADCLQLRAKGMDDAKFMAVAVEFAKICREWNALSIINDRVDIAVASAADGVHLGVTDIPVERARKLQMTPLIVGKSTHSGEQLRLAIAENPTYVSLGPVFSTGTKPDAQPVGLEYVKQGLQMLEGTGIAHVAIGGINLNNVDQVLNAGAKAVAVCSAATESKTPTKACKELKEKLRGAGG